MDNGLSDHTDTVLSNQPLLLFHVKKKTKKKTKKPFSISYMRFFFFFLLGLSSKALHFSVIQLLNPFFFFLCPSASSVTSSCDEIARRGTWRGQGPPVLPSPVLLAGAELFHAVTKFEHYKWFLRCEPWQHPHKWRDCLNFSPPFYWVGGAVKPAGSKHLIFTLGVLERHLMGVFDLTLSLLFMSASQLFSTSSDSLLHRQFFCLFYFWVFWGLFVQAVVMSEVMAQ